MKPWKLWVLLCCVLLCSQAVLAQPLPNRWRFKTGDDASYSAPSYDDSAWSRIWVPSPWKDEGVGKYHGLAWYRVQFEVEPRFAGQSMYLELGRIADVDETWLNGRRIGGSGHMRPHQVSAWDTLRVYRVPRGLLRKHNVVAVRVLDFGGASGMWGGPVGLIDQAEYRRQLHPPLGPRHTWNQLPTTNGLIAAVYDADTDSVMSLLPHIFQSYDFDRPVHPVLRHLQPNARNRPRSVRYLRDTHVIEVDYGDVQARYFAPFSTAEKVLYVEVSGPRRRVERWRYTWDKASGTVLTASRTFTRPNGQADRYFLFGFTDANHPDSHGVETALRRLSPDVLRRELAFMHDVHARCKIPKGLREDERHTLLQSISVLKMAQVDAREIFPKARGQILASLPPGGWNIAWVRDGFYSTLALNRLGLYAEARAMLEFELGADSGHFVHFADSHGQEVGVGAPYQISVCRYFGGGKEESDGSEDKNPNIELDGFGLFLIAFSDYVERSGDREFFNRHAAAVETLVADAAIACVAANGLIKPDSGPWEHHLLYRQFAYDSIACAAGLRDFARLEARLGSPSAPRYARAARQMAAAIRRELVTPNGWIKGTAESAADDVRGSHDGGIFEAFALRVLDDKALFRSNLREYDRSLGFGTPRRGFSRINHGDSYENPEWLLMDLRAASGMRRHGQPRRASLLFDWVSGQSRLNYNLIPEMYGRDRWTYEGSVPMVGFGAGAYVLTLTDLDR